jgi:hypothetical protein
MTRSLLSVIPAKRSAERESRHKVAFAAGHPLMRFALAGTTAP